MAKPSTQHKLDRVRPPRVQITYDVETGGAIEIKELPFVVGVLGDFSGQPEQPLPKLKERRFVEVTPDNFDSVLESMKPHLAFAVENKLSEDSNAGQIKVDLKFKSLEDFEPEQVARQVKPLKELLDGVITDLVKVCVTEHRDNKNPPEMVGNRESSYRQCYDKVLLYLARRGKLEQVSS